MDELTAHCLAVLQSLSDGLPSRSLDTEPGDQVAAGATSEGSPGQLLPSGTGDAAASFVHTSPLGQNLLVSIPDGPMRHNKALYDAGHAPVRTSSLRCRAAVRPSLHIARAENSVTQEGVSVLATLACFPPQKTSKTGSDMSQSVPSRRGASS